MIRVNFRGRNPLTKSKTRADEVEAYVRALSEASGKNETYVVDLVVDLTLRDLLMTIASSRPTFLVIKEPQVVIPVPYSIDFLTRFFDDVILLGRSHDAGFQVERWPQRLLDEPSFDVPNRKKKVVAIAANKFSAASGELYSFRRKVFSELDVDVFGAGWSQSVLQNIFAFLHSLLIHSLIPGEMRLSREFPDFRPFPSRVQVEDKQAILREYNVCLVIENSKEVITEKLFDAWMAGVVPVYVGPSLSELGIPRGLAIEAEPTVEDIRKSIDRALDFDRRDYLDGLKRFLASERTVEDWGAKAVWRRIAQRHAGYLDR